jgi:sirohydrochlorin cobaltochelatase
VEAEPTFRDIVEAVKTAGIYDHAVLLPLMVVSGEHALNDMAGESETSWRSMFEAAGIRTDCILEGLGEYEDIRRIYVRHAKEAPEDK